ncbi:MAG TPA: AraC family transcriptional regulator, partial [Bacteroidales bacterium]|nr:AraC family transcriptional regulator [Bacteroidales bacterium]
FYVRSRLFNKFRFSGSLLAHFIPAIGQMSILLFVLVRNENPRGLIWQISNVSYFFIQVQLLIYNLVTLFLIYKYRREIPNFTSSSEQLKINWLLVITYGVTIASLIDFIFYLIPGLSDLELGYILFWMFIQIFFFKSLIQPDQFLGLDEKKTLPPKLSSDMGQKYFRDIEEVIHSNKLFLEPDLSLHNVAQAVNLSDRVVSQVIKINTGNNFSDYINRKRIDYSRNLLENFTGSAKNILEVLYESGFNSKSVFNLQFKRLTGLSPKEYRKQYANPETF